MEGCFGYAWYATRWIRVNCIILLDGLLWYWSHSQCFRRWCI